ncbi:hypothetical protein GCM10010279_24880 [Streptomyces mutabilis]|nr:hypothetical protein GCM10010279_24880 [Streptomyces mutabilis]
MTPDPSHDARPPVLVWLHGGALTRGSESSAPSSSTEMPCGRGPLSSAAKAEVPASVAEATGTAIASTRACRAPTRLSLTLRCRRRPPGVNVLVEAPSGVPVMKGSPKIGCFGLWGEAPGTLPAVI